MDMSIAESPFGGRVIKTQEFSGLRLVVVSFLQELSYFRHGFATPTRSC